MAHIIFATAALYSYLGPRLLAARTQINAIKEFKDLEGAVIGSSAIASKFYQQAPEAMTVGDIDVLFDISEFNLDALFNSLEEQGYEPNGKVYKDESTLVSFKKGDVNLLLALTEKEFKLRVLANEVAIVSHTAEFSYLDQREKDNRIRVHNFICRG